jgi:hypothetical protein
LPDCSRVGGEEDEEIAVLGFGGEDIGADRGVVVEQLRAGAELERIRGLRLEDVFDADEAVGERHRADAGLVEAARAEAAAVAAIDGQVGIGLPGQRHLGLPVVERFGAHIAGGALGEAGNVGQKGGRCQRRVFALVVVVAQRGVDRELVAEIVGD